MTHCLICCEPLEGNHTRYHDMCARRLFGSSSAPTLRYSWADLNKLAAQLVKRSVSIPGVQAKLSLHLESKDGEGDRLTLVGLEGEFILKPPTKSYPEMPELEQLCMLLAGRVGIDVAACGLILLSSGERAFITKRMDRPNGRVLHMEDFCQLTDKLTEQKYRGSMEQVGRTLLRHSSNPGFDALRLYELTLFCFLTGNADMHLKNFSLLHDADGMVRLSPAYNLLPTRLLTPKDPDELALTLNGKKSRLREKDFAAFGMALGLTARQILNTHERLRERLSTAALLVKASFASRSAQKQFLALVHDRSSRVWK